MRECLVELLQDFGRAVAVARRVSLRVHWVHDYKHLLVLWCLRVERPIVQLIPNYSSRCFFLGSISYPLIIQRKWRSRFKINLHFIERVDSVKLGVEAVRVEVKEAHQQARGRNVGTLLQFEVVHVGHYQQDRTVRADSA